MGQAPDRQLAGGSRHERRDRRHGQAREGRRPLRRALGHGGGAILGGLVLGAIAVFIIEREFVKSAAFAAVGALLTFFGFIHGESLGIGRTPLVALSYLAVAAFLVGCAKYATASEPAAELAEERDSEETLGHDALPEPAK